MIKNEKEEKVEQDLIKRCQDVFKNFETKQKFVFDFNRSNVKKVLQTKIKTKSFNKETFPFFSSFLGYLKFKETDISRLQSYERYRTLFDKWEIFLDNYLQINESEEDGHFEQLIYFLIIYTNPQNANQNSITFITAICLIFYELYDADNVNPLTNLCVREKVEDLINFFRDLNSKSESNNEENLESSDKEKTVAAIDEEKFATDIDKERFVEAIDEQGPVTVIYEREPVTTIDEDKSVEAIDEEMKESFDEIWVIIYKVFEDNDGVLLKNLIGSYIECGLRYLYDCFLAAVAKSEENETLETVYLFLY